MDDDSDQKTERQIGARGHLLRVRLGPTRSVGELAPAVTQWLAAWDWLGGSSARGGHDRPRMNHRKLSSRNSIAVMFGRLPLRAGEGAQTETGEAYEALPSFTVASCARVRSMGFRAALTRLRGGVCFICIFRN